MASMIRAQLPDDRGNLVPVASLGRILREHELADFQKHLQAVITRAGRSPKPPRRFQVAVLLCALGLASSMFLFTGRFYSHRYGAFILLTVMLGWFMIIAALVTRANALAFAPAMVAELLRRGRCPRCLYVLDSTLADRDGLVVCPECGAAWRADRLTRTGHTEL